MNLKKIILLFFLIPNLLLASDAITSMKNIRDSYRLNYERYRTNQYTTTVQEHYLKVFSDVVNISQVMTISAQKNYQKFNTLYNEWRRIESDLSISIEEKALFYASIKSSLATLSRDSNELINKAERLHIFSGEVCSASRVNDVASRFDPKGFFKIPRHHFSPDSPPKFETSFYVEVGMNMDGSNTYVSRGTALGAVNDPKLSEDQQAATGIGAAIIAFVWCGGTSVISLGTASAYTCSPPVMSAIFTGAALILGFAFDLANKHKAINDYSKKMIELRDIYNETNDHIDNVHAKLSINYQEKFQSNCVEAFKSKSDISVFLEKVVGSVTSSNQQIQNGTSEFNNKFEEFKDSYANWLDNEVVILSKLQGRLELMLKKSLGEYYYDLIALDNKARDYFVHTLLPQIQKLKDVEDLESTRWVNLADDLFEKEIIGDMKFNASPEFEAMPWPAYKRVIKQSLEDGL